MANLLDRLKAALADRYRIERELGSGGMATVYLAHDVKHDRQVALKVMRPELSAILGGERFLREIRIAAKLNHPHILALYDSGSAEGFLYYVMPHVEGESLRNKLRREKQLSVDETVTITQADLDEARSRLVSDPDHPTYCIGCPHCSLKEMEETANLVKGKDLKGKLWVFTSRGVYEQADKAGLVKIIEDAGGRVYRDTCMVVAPLHEMGWHGVGTNSFKGGHYSVAHGFDTKLNTVDKLVKEAAE